MIAEEDAEQEHDGQEPDAEPFETGKHCPIGA
jgi:hypothetical protein